MPSGRCLDGLYGPLNEGIEGLKGWLFTGGEVWPDKQGFTVPVPL